MIKVYECWTIMDNEGNQEKDMACELWGASTKHPDSKFYFSDWQGKTDLLPVEYQYYQWLLYIASCLTWPFYARELVEYATENFYKWG